MLQAKNKTSALVKKTLRQYLSSTKGKKKTDQLLNYQHLRDKMLSKVSANKERVHAAGGKKLHLNFIREMNCQNAS